MAVLKSKSRESSPVFEKLNRERLKHCSDTAASAREAIATSRKLTQESRELINYVKKYKTG